jgi:hypothetical protein
MPEPGTSAQSAITLHPARIPGAYPRFSIWGGLLLFIFGLILPALGATQAILQQYRLATYQPMPALIVRTGIREHYRKRGNDYEPLIRYRYRVNDRIYEFDRVWPSGSVSRSSAWAHGIVAQYAKGTTTTAWYSPADPSSAFLIRQPQSQPYFLCFSTAFIAIMGLHLAALGLHGARRVAEPDPDERGWFRVREDGTLRGRVLINFLAALCWYGYAGLVIGHDYYVIRQLDGFFYGASIASALFGLVFLVPLWRKWRLCHDFLDADLRVSKPQFRPGDSFEIRLAQPVRKSLEIEQLSLGLRCVYDSSIGNGNRKTQKRAIEAWSEWKDLAVNRNYQAGMQLELDGHFSIPANAWPSSPPRSTDYQHYRWQFALGVIARGEPKLEVFFPITVDPAP